MAAKRSGGGNLRWVSIADMAMAFLWVFSNAVFRALIDIYLVKTDEAIRVVLKRIVAIPLLFGFYGLGRSLGDANYNPLSVLSRSLFHDSLLPLFHFALIRMPLQIVGAIGGAFSAVSVMPEYYKHRLKGPQLQVNIQVGAVVEGLLTFLVVCISLIVALNGPKSVVRKVWITSIFRVLCSILGSSYTGSAMNPATAFGWAYLKNQHLTWEHFYVYWFAPTLGTLLAVWTVQKLLVLRIAKRKND